MPARRLRSTKRSAAAPRSAPAKGSAPALAAAIAAHQRGQLDTARQGYARILEREPNNFDALHLFGVVAAQSGQPELAEPLIRLALQVRPACAEAHNNLALALKALGRNAEAEGALHQALAIAPDYLDALRNLAGIVAARGGRAEAIALLERAAHIAPAGATILGNLGALLLAGGDPGAAFDRLSQASRLAPRDAGILANLGRAALELDRVTAGVDACERALAANPQNVPARVTLGALERVGGHFDRAERHLRCALGLAGCTPEARINLATVLAEMGRFTEAEAELDALIAVEPDNGEARANRAIIRLGAGRLDGTWAESAWRWRSTGAPAPQPVAAPEWDGDPLPEASLFVWPEQGLGEQLLFASMIAELPVDAGHVVLGCEPRLVSLFARSFPDVTVVPAAELIDGTRTPGSRDRQASMADLPQWLRPSFASFPRRAGYLVADDERVASWRTWLRDLGTGVKVGISWRSQNLRGERRLACTELSQWTEVLRVHGARFVCLQYDECAGEVAAASEQTGTPIHVPPGLDQRNDLDGVAALMRGLDLVISAPTTVCLLAGALGVRTWMLARGIDWQALGRAHVPWQPSVRRFYRPWDAPWEPVLAQMAIELSAVATAGTASIPVRSA